MCATIEQTIASLLGEWRCLECSHVVMHVFYEIIGACQNLMTVLTSRFVSMFPMVIYKGY